MIPRPEEERLIKIYLLGDLTEKDREDFEERLMLNDGMVDQLMLIEAELIDDYVFENLSGSERRKFEQYFLISPDRKQRLVLAKRLTHYASTSRDRKETQ